jgi:hypothetical protein
MVVVEAGAAGVQASAVVTRMVARCRGSFDPALKDGPSNRRCTAEIHTRRYVSERTGR